MLDQSRGDLSPESIMPDGISRADFLKAAGAAGLLVTASGTVISVLSSPAEAQTLGTLSEPFEEPVIYIPVIESKKGSKKGGRHDIVKSDETCIEDESPTGTVDPRFFCKPAAGSNAILPDGRVLYWNALEGTEDSEAFVLNPGDASIEDDQSRVMTINYKNLQKSKWRKPFRATSGVRDNKASELVPGLSIQADRDGNNGTMFCAHQCHLPDGTVLVVGGTQYYQEGVIELQGLPAARLFDPPTNRWYRIENMNYGRWYPASVPLANGNIFVASGVFKLEKPVYLPPQDPEPGEPPFLDSGRNVLFTEILNLDTAKWEDNGEPGRRSLPLMPRMHTLPNGHVSFNGAGQAWSPNGQSFDQALWNIVGTYDPEANAWTDHGTTGAGTSLPGVRFSTFEVPLLLEPDPETGDYKKMELLTGAGTLGVSGSPGSFVPVSHSKIDVFTVDGDTVTYGPSRDTGPTQVGSNPAFGPPGTTGRWFSDATLLPNGQVFISGGGNRDEVIFPGQENPIPELEIFDPETETWSVVGELPPDHLRTYHNTNSLLPDGRVLIGGHAVIPFGYVSHDSDVIPGTRNSEARDPSFQIYTPDYALGDRPKINAGKKPKVVKIGRKLEIKTPDASSIDQVVLMRVPSTTHINDTEQRGLILPFEASSKTVTAQMPKTFEELGAPGFFLAFILSEGIPSEGMFVKVPMG